MAEEKRVEVIFGVQIDQASVAAAVASLTTQLAAATDKAISGKLRQTPEKRATASGNRQGDLTNLRDLVAANKQYQRVLQDVNIQQAQLSRNALVRGRAEIQLISARLRAEREARKEILRAQEQDPSPALSRQLDQITRQIKTTFAQRQALLQQYRKDEAAALAGTLRDQTFLATQQRRAAEALDRQRVRAFQSARNAEDRAEAARLRAQEASAQALDRQRTRAYAQQLRQEQQFQARRGQVGVQAFDTLRYGGIRQLGVRFLQGDFNQLFTNQQGRFAGVGNVLGTLLGGGGAGVSALTTALGGSAGLAAAIGTAVGAVGLLTGAIGAFGSAVQQAYANSVAYTANVGRLQRLTGADTRDAAGLVNALTAINKEDDPFATITLNQITANIAKLQRRTPDTKLDRQAEAFLDGLNALGIDPKEITSLNQFLLKLSRSLRGLNQLERSLRIQQVGGLFGSDVANFTGFRPEILERILQPRTNTIEQDIFLSESRAAVYAEATQAVRNFETALARAITPLDLFAKGLQTSVFNILSSFTENIFGGFTGGVTRTEAERQLSLQNSIRARAEALRLGPFGNSLASAIEFSRIDPLTGQVRKELATEGELRAQIAELERQQNVRLPPGFRGVDNKERIEALRAELELIRYKATAFTRQRSPSLETQTEQEKADLLKKQTEELEAQQKLREKAIKDNQEQVAALDKLQAAVTRQQQAEQALREAQTRRNAEVGASIVNIISNVEQQGDEIARNFERFRNARQRQITLEDLANDIVPVTVRPSKQQQQLAKDIARARRLERRAQRQQLAVDRGAFGATRPRKKPLSPEEVAFNQRAQQFRQEDLDATNAELAAIRARIGTTGPTDVGTVQRVFRQRGLSKAQVRETARLAQEIESFETAIDERTFEGQEAIFKTFITNAANATKSVADFDATARRAISVFSDAAGGQLDGAAFFLALGEQALLARAKLATTNEELFTLLKLRKELGQFQIDLAPQLAGVKGEDGKPIEIERDIAIKYNIVSAEEFDLAKGPAVQRNEAARDRQDAARAKLTASPETLVKNFLARSGLDPEKGLQYSLDLSLDANKTDIDKLKAAAEKAREDVRKLAEEKMTFAPAIDFVRGTISFDQLESAINDARNALIAKLSNQRLVVQIPFSYQPVGPGVPPQIQVPGGGNTAAPTAPGSRSPAPTPPRGRTPQPRESGGPVTQSRFFIVGERGPELFVPKQDGYILNARDTREFLNAVRSAGRPAVNPRNIEALLLTRFDMMLRAQANRQIYRTPGSQSLRSTLLARGFDIEAYAALIKKEFRTDRLRGGPGGDALSGGGGGGSEQQAPVLPTPFEDRSYDSIEEARARRLINPIIERVIQEAERIYDEFGYRIDGGSGTGRRASGGPVRAGMPYIVGDALGRSGGGGGELFMPFGAIGGIKAGPSYSNSVTMIDQRKLEINASGGDARRVARTVSTAARGFLSESFAMQRRDSIRRTGGRV